MASKNVKTLEITWIQWATLIAAIATLLLVLAPRMRLHTPPPQNAGEVKEVSRQERTEGKQRQRGRYEQPPELIAP